MGSRVLAETAEIVRKPSDRTDPAPVIEEIERQERETHPAPRQAALPLPWQLVHSGDLFNGGGFAHPAEVTFARILNFYRVRWAYEPTTFALSYSPEGLPSEMFTPDFYLPEHNLYVELTTMRQRLVTRKNRKLRRIRELYPNIQVKLLYRRDCERLGDSYRDLKSSAAVCHVGRTLFDEQQIQSRIDGLADRIVADSPCCSQTAQPSVGDGGRSSCVKLQIWPETACIDDGEQSLCEQTPVDDRLLVVSVDRGSAVFAHRLSAALEARGMAIECDRVTLTRHQSPLGERRVRIGRGPRTPVAGRRVLLIADVVSTGLSHAYLTGWLRRRDATQVDICTLLDRQPARLVDVPVRYVAFDAPNDLLVGFGLHLRRQFRHLPFIATVVTQAAVPEAT